MSSSSGEPSELSLVATVPINPTEPLRVTIVTNIPTPYRIPVYEALDRDESIDLTVIYFSNREPNRHWQIPRSSVTSTTLRGIVLTIGGRYIHVNSGLLVQLLKVRPNVIITTGYNPGHLFAFLYSLVFRVGHIVQTDGTVKSEARLGRLHRAIRRFVVGHSRAFVGASESSLDLLRQLGAPDGKLFKSALAVDNSAFFRTVPHRPLDLIFVGQLTQIKNPDFALDVAAGLADVLGRKVSLAFVGTGELQENLKAKARDLRSVDVTFAGFVQPIDLPDWYLQARVFLFPTLWDPWGLVANEACAAGVPVIVSKNAGCANELVRNGVSGFVEELDLDVWIELALLLITDDDRWNEMSAAAKSDVEAFSFSAASAGLSGAANAAGGR